MRNTSTRDIIFNYLSYFKNLIIFKKIITFQEYYRTHGNSFNVLMNVLRKRIPIDVILRNGNHIVLHNSEAQPPWA